MSNYIKKQVLFASLTSLCLAALIGCSNASKNELRASSTSGSSSRRNETSSNHLKYSAQIWVERSSIEKLVEGYGGCTNNKFWGAHYQIDLYGSTSNRCKELQETIYIEFSLYDSKLPADGIVTIWTKKNRSYGWTYLTRLSGRFVAVDKNKGFALKTATGSFSRHSNGSSTLEVRAHGKPGDDDLEVTLFLNNREIGDDEAELDSYHY